MQDNENTQGQGLEIRRTQDRNQNVSTEEEQRRGIGDVGQSSWHDNVGLDRSDWRWGNPFGTFGGEIINRLISQAEEKLKEAGECIEWYQRQSGKLKHELEELKQLKQFHLQMMEEAAQSNSIQEEE